MQHHHNEGGLFSISGWLFADMFLALMIIFIVASTTGVYQPKQANPKPPLTIQGITSHASYVTITVDAAALQRNDPAAMQAVKDQVKKQLSGNRNDKAGLVLTFGGGPNQQQDTDVAQHVNVVLRTIGAEHFVFDKASYDAYIDLGAPLGKVTVEIYFFILSSTNHV